MLSALSGIECFTDVEVGIGLVDFIKNAALVDFAGEEGRFELWKFCSEDKEKFNVLSDDFELLVDIADGFCVCILRLFDLFMEKRLGINEFLFNEIFFEGFGILSCLA